MDNDAYRKSRRTHKPFTTTPEQADAEFARLYPEAVARAQERKLRPQKKRTPWGTNFSMEDED